MSQTRSMVPDAPFSLREAAAFGFGPQRARANPDAGMAMAFGVDGYRSAAGVYLRQSDDGTVTGEVFGDADPDAAWHQALRVVGLDVAAAAWLEVGRRDPVLGMLQARVPGFRPVAFYSPWEAAAWSVLSQRRQRSQAAGVRTRLSEQFGTVFDLPDGPLASFPLPETVLGIGSFPSIEPQRMERLRGVAEAALDGRLDAAALVAMPAAEATAQLLTLPGIGPTFAMLVLGRSTGATDVPSATEPAIAAYIQHYWQLSAPASAQELARISDAWRPFRTWAGVLIRASGDREGLPRPAFREGPRRRPGAGPTT